MLPQTDIVMSAEGASILGVSQATFNRMAQRGEIPSVGKANGATGPRLFDRSEIERIAAERKAVAS